MKIKKLLLSLFLGLIFPLELALAYSNEVIVGGQNIGIEVKTEGVLVVGLYKVNNELIAKNSNVTTGDYIVKVNGNTIKSIDDYSKEISNDIDKESIDVEYKRDGKFYKSELKLVKENDEYKTGLYVKDTINGIGTLTLIDPESGKFLALGHQIQDSSTNTILNIDSGSIYYSYITGIKKSSNGLPGEKEAVTNIDEKYGIVSKNTDSGIFGTYEKEIDKNNLVKIADREEIVLGGASILTVLDGEEVKEYSINIDKIDKKDRLKNILFTITDEELISKTGGIVQGMSGSPIMQNGKIIGAVTHVIVDNCKKGYGIFIVNMLEESER